MPVPPWGSVWLERDNLLMGDTTAEYQAFLQSQGMTFNSRQNEPEDQFGLMLLACCALLDAGKDAAVNQLLEVYLLPWGFRYLERLQSNAVSPFYARLAVVTTRYLQEVQQQRVIEQLLKERALLDAAQRDRLAALLLAQPAGPSGIERLHRD